MRASPHCRHPEVGSALPVRFLQRTLDFWADTSHDVDIVSAQLIEGTRSHGPACRRPPGPMQERHFTEKFAGDKRCQVPSDSAILPGHSDHASGHRNNEEPDPLWRTMISPAGTVLRRSFVATVENSPSGISVKNGTFFRSSSGPTASFPGWLARTPLSSAARSSSMASATPSGIIPARACSAMASCSACRSILLARRS